jgi:O-antigen/teichoic acid export membrane protein
VGALTYYSSPFALVSRTAIFPASVAITLFPAFSYYQAHRPEAVAELSWRPLKYLVLTAMPLLVVLVVFAPEILALWLKGDFAARSTGVLRILAVSFSLNALAYIPFSAVHGLGRPDFKAKLDLLAVPLFVILSWILIPRYGVAGAALAKLGVTIFDTVGLFWIAWRMGAFSPLRASWRGVRRAVIVATGYGAISVVAPSLKGAAIGGKVGIAVVAGVLYSVVVWWLVLDARERLLIRQVRPWGVRREVAV